VRALLGVAVSIAVAGAVALTSVIAHAGAWWLPLGIAGGLLLLAGCVFVLPRLLAPTRVPEDLAGVHELSAKDRIQFADDRRKLQNDIRTAMLQAVAGGAVLVGVLFTWQQQQATSRQIADQLTITRQGQVGERFSRAVGQLGNASIDVRLGGLYELEQLARQAPDRRLVIIEVVAAYIRQHARSPANATGAPTRPPPQDVAAAFTILGRRSVENGDPLTDLRKVDLGRVDLAGVGLHDTDLNSAKLRDADLGGADLHSSDLEATVLRGANLRGANLRGANLGGADLGGADLRDVDFRGVELGGANLRDAHFGGETDFGGAYLGGANLRGADLQGVDLSGTILGGVDFGSVVLRGANLIFADLHGLDLSGSDLRGAYLGGANLRSAKLSGTDLDGARIDRFTQWPQGFDWRGAGVLQERSG
jgi:uncharacterized protein YjbI with pentapeptide repeats